MKIAIFNSENFNSIEKRMFQNYIDFINRKTSKEWSGDSNCYYIYDDEVMFSDCVGEPSEEYQVMTIHEWNEKFMQFENEFVLHDGEIVRNIDPELIVEMYNGEYAWKSDCRFATLNNEYAPIDEVYRTRHGNTYIESTECELYIAYSEYHCEMVETDRDDVFYGYVDGNRDETYFQITWGSPFQIYDNLYMDGEAARYHGLLYHEGNDEWYTEEDYPRDNNASYHDLRRRKRFDEAPKFSIGFEIEKEDDDAVEIDYQDLYDRTDWIKEKDGSLCDSSGYELVTPAFDLYSSDLEDEIAKDSDLQTLINADTSSSCGGHINVASNLFDTETLFEHLSGWLPLFYSMYEHRIETNYSKAKKKHSYKYSSDKYSAVYIKSSVLEFRIPSAVKNVTNLLWRRDLLRIMCSSIKEVKIKGFESYYKGSSEIEILQMMMNPKSKLYKHLRLVYSQEKLIDKVELFIKYSQSFNDKQLPKLIRSQVKVDTIENASNQLGA